MPPFTATTYVRSVGLRFHEPKISFVIELGSLLDYLDNVFGVVKQHSIQLFDQFFNVECTKCVNVYLPRLAAALFAIIRAAVRIQVRRRKIK
jgi:hypothetical protein